MIDATDSRDADAVIATFDGAVEAMHASPYYAGSVVRVPARGRLVATGDLHDNPFHLDRVIELARLDESVDHHVTLHELIHGDRLVNGMDFSYRILTRVADLVRVYPDQVHPMLANHELSQMTGKGVSKGAGNSVELFRDAVEFVFGDRCDEVNDAIDGFFRALPLAVQGAGLLCAHSLPSARVMNRFDTGVLERPLTDDDYCAPGGAAYMMTWGRRYTDEQVEQLADRWGVSLFCLGHEYIETGIEVRGPRVLVLNSDHDRAVALPLDLADLPSAEAALMYAIPLRS